MKDYFLFIVWKNAFPYFDEILNDIRNSFEIRNIFNIVWDDSKWIENLKRFYGTNLPSVDAKCIECGKESFYAIVVQDNNCKYEQQETSNDYSVVNKNIFDKKQYYREISGGGYKIHATNTVQETNHNLTLLFGKNLEDFLKEYPENNNKIITLKRNIFGYDGWNNIGELFYALNNCCNYVVLRDFENDLKELTDDSDYDADILCDDAINFSLVLNSKKTDNGIYVTTVGFKQVKFDIKYVGDGYYCDKMEKDILNSKKINNFFYIPNNDYLYNSHLLHALIHKNNFETEYNNRLNELYVFHDHKKSRQYYASILSKWMLENEYTITIYKENPEKINVDSIMMFDDRLFNKNIIEDIGLRKKINELEKENQKLKEDIKIIENTKGYRMLVALRKVIIKFKTIIRV